jgi:hypothetical protein
MSPQYRAAGVPARIGWSPIQRSHRLLFYRRAFGLSASVILGSLSPGRSRPCRMRNRIKCSWCSRTSIASATRTKAHPYLRQSPMLAAGKRASSRIGLTHAVLRLSSTSRALEPGPDGEKVSLTSPYAASDNALARMALTSRSLKKSPRHETGEKEACGFGLSRHTLNGPHANSES